MQETYIEASAEVRYWEDATINGATDTEGTLTPLRQIPGNDEICTTPREDRAVIGRLTEPPIPWKRTARPVVSAGAGWLTTLR